MYNADKLRITPEAEKVAVLVYRFTAAFPRSERDGLISQMRRAAVSVGSNIYDGAGCDTAKGFAQYLVYSRRSANELIFQTRVSVLVGIGNENNAKPLTQQLIRTKRMINALITDLRSQ